MGQEQFTPSSVPVQKEREWTLQAPCNAGGPGSSGLLLNPEHGINGPQEANTIHKPLSTAPLSFILVVSAAGMASLANSSMIPEAALLVFYPEPMPACGTQGPYCRKIYHSIHLHPLWIINDFTDLSFFYFFPKLSICIAIVSLYIETIWNLLCLKIFLPHCSFSVAYQKWAE